MPSAQNRLQSQYRLRTQSAIQQSIRRLNQNNRSIDKKTIETFSKNTNHFQPNEVESIHSRFAHSHLHQFPGAYGRCLKILKF